MKSKKLFNPQGKDENRKIIGADITNLFNFNNVKYDWASKMYRTMMENFWLPEKISLQEDVLSYKNLTPEEKQAYDGILSFLVFLDSIQANNVSFISNYVTAPEINLLLIIQTYQEAIHSQSYGYLIETVIPKSHRAEIYELWREDNILFERNKIIAQSFQDFRDNPNLDNFKRVLINNYLLEGLYFYNGFAFFYLLASRNHVMGTADMIKYINRDELTHVSIFRNIINILKLENNLFNDKEIIDAVKEAVESEINWSLHIMGEKILGITPATIKQYTEYRANLLLAGLGIEKIYKNSIKSPYPNIEKIADLAGDGEVKANFFEAKVTSYNQSSVVRNWEDF